jgi:hypothetical protein
MKNLKLPKKSVISIYCLKGSNGWSAETTTTTTSQGDPENTCTTLVTTTHFAPR